MEQKAAQANQQVSGKGDLEDTVVAMFPNVQYTLDTQPQEQQVSQRVYDLCRVRRCVIVLSPELVRIESGGILGRDSTSSHQFSVDVTGLQYPAFDGG